MPKDEDDRDGDSLDSGLIKSIIEILDEEELDFHYSEMFVDNFIHDHNLLDMDAEFISNKIIKWINDTMI